MPDAQISVSVFPVLTIAMLTARFNQVAGRNVTSGVARVAIFNAGAVVRDALGRARGSGARYVAR